MEVANRWVKLLKVLQPRWNLGEPKGIKTLRPRRKVNYLLRMKHANHSSLSSAH